MRFPDADPEDEDAPEPEPPPDTSVSVVPVVPVEDWRCGTARVRGCCWGAMIVVGAVLFLTSSLGVCGSGARPMAMAPARLFTSEEGSDWDWTS